MALRRAVTLGATRYLAPGSITPEARFPLGRPLELPKTQLFIGTCLRIRRRSIRCCSHRTRDCSADPCAAGFTSRGRTVFGRCRPRRREFGPASSSPRKRRRCACGPRLSKSTSRFRMAASSASIRRVERVCSPLTLARLRDRTRVLRRPTTACSSCAAPVEGASRLRVRTTPQASVTASDRQ
jgi:hypothetical protein